MSVIFSIGAWGGFYAYNGYAKRLCIGWLAITFIPKDIDVVIDELMESNA